MSDEGRRKPGREILKRVSRSFYLSLVFLPKPMREPLSLGYLLARASDTIADAGAMAPALRTELLAKFREAVVTADVTGVEAVRSQLRSSGGIEHEGERELVESLPECLLWLASVDEEMRGVIVAVLEVITAGQAWDIERFESMPAGELAFCESAEELERYTYRVAGCVGEFWTRAGFLSGVDFAGHAMREELMESGRLYGQGLQLVNILRDGADDLAKGRCYLPRPEIDAAGGGIEAAWVAVAEPWREKARGWLQQGDRYADCLGSRRVRLATRLPARLGLQTLDKLDAAGPAVLEGRVKISRSQVWRTLLACSLR